MNRTITETLFKDPTLHFLKYSLKQLESFFTFLWSVDVKNSKNCWFACVQAYHDRIKDWNTHSLTLERPILKEYCQHSRWFSEN